MQNMAQSEKDFCTARLDIQQLRLEVLRWRKQHSLMRLKMASAVEESQLRRSNEDLLAKHNANLTNQVHALSQELTTVRQQLADLTSQKSLLEVEAVQHLVRLPGMYLQLSMSSTLNSE